MNTQRNLQRIILTILGVALVLVGIIAGRASAHASPLNRTCRWKVLVVHHAFSSEVRMRVERNNCVGILKFRAFGLTILGHRAGRWVTKVGARSVAHATPTTWINWGYEWKLRNRKPVFVKTGGTCVVITNLEHTCL